MAEGSFPQLQAIMKSLDGESWSRLEPFRLPVLRSLHHTRINYLFLHTLAQFWDARKHVFRFGTVELCPLPEEFEALLGYKLDPTCQLAIPRLISPNPHTIQYHLRMLYGQSSRGFAGSIVDSEIRLESLIEILLNIGTAKVRWPRAMALCLYSQFLLVSLSGNCDPKILHVLDQVENGYNPFPPILAETLVGLDNFASLGRLSGSPILLEVSLLPLYFLCLMPIFYRRLTALFCRPRRCGSMRS